MASSELVTLVAKGIATGQTEDQIREHLSKEGNTVEDINGALAMVRLQNSPFRTVSMVAQKSAPAHKANNSLLFNALIIILFVAATPAAYGFYTGVIAPTIASNFSHATSTPTTATSTRNPFALTYIPEGTGQPAPRRTTAQKITSFFTGDTSGGNTGNTSNPTTNTPTQTQNPAQTPVQKPVVIIPGIVPPVVTPPVVTPPVVTPPVVTPPVVTPPVVTPPVVTPPVVTPPVVTPPVVTPPVVTPPPVVVPPAPSGNYTVYAGCQTPATSYANTMYVDPAAGSDTGDGTQAHPYKTLGTVLAQNKLKTDTHVILLPGDHGIIFADNYSNIALSNATSGWVWLDFQQGATAEMMDIRVMHRWLITNAVVTGAPPGRNLVAMSSSGNMVIADSQLYTARDSSGWTIDQWLNDADSGISSDDSVCVSILRNRITNVRFGMQVFSRGTSATASDNSIKVLIDGNVIKNFSADGIRPNGTDITVHNNGIYDAYVSGPDGDWNHDDGIQGFAPIGGVFSNVIIDHNWVQESTGGPNRALYSSLQGISSFDGVFANSRVTNNVVLVSAPHGISWYNVRNFTIDHNTIANITSNGNPTWILMINSDSSDVVSNNSASSFSGGPGSTVTLINNIEVPDPAAAYTTFDPANNRYDFTPKPGGPLEGHDVGAVNTRPIAIAPATRNSANTQLAAAQEAASGLSLGGIWHSIWSAYVNLFEWFIHLFRKG